LWERLDRLSDEWGSEGGSAGPQETSLLAFLTQCVASARVDGFWSAKSEHPTKDQAWAHIFAPPREHTKAREDWLEREPTEADWAKAATIIEWASSKPVDSDYWHNVKVLIAGLAVDHRKAGIAASLVGVYAKEQGEIAARNERPVSKHFGSVGQRTEIRATCERAHSYDTAYGTKTVVVLRLDGGELLVWFASGVPEVEAGKAYTGKVTIKKHDKDKRGEPQTVVLRCSLSEVSA
jgi:hypothetical protein